MRSKLIIALDYSSETAALALIDRIEPSSCILKVGSEMFTLFGPNFIQKLTKQGYQVFLDLKFHDIPNTVAQACRSAAELGVWMINLHALGGLKMMEHAKNALANYSKPPLLIAVTMLTSMSESELSEINIYASINEQVEKLAYLAFQANLDGVVCSAHEVPKIKSVCGTNFLTVTPGIRLAGDSSHDQTRIVTPEQAVQLGSDYLVIGRSITAAQDPNKVINSILNIFHE